MSTHSLKGLPNSIGSLISLNFLDLSGCQSIRVLPNTICGLVALRTLDVSNCLGTETGLTTHPPAIGPDGKHCSAISLQTALDNMPGLKLMGGDEYPRFVSRAASALAASINRRRRKWSSRICTYCDETVTNESPPFRCCGACRAAFYCSVECHQGHWKGGHREECSAYRRIRRRMCDVCGAFAGHDQSPFPVCGGCDARRYCGEACQIADWEAGHAQSCAGLLDEQPPRPANSFELFSAGDEARLTRERTERLRRMGMRGS